MATRAVLTYGDYAALPDDGRRYELHRGELSLTPAPGTRHQRTVVAFTLRLAEYVRSRQIGEVLVAPTDCILSDTTVVQPDLLYVATDRQSIVSERGIEGAPTLVVEILSPATERVDRERKLALYAEHGVPYYWIADPAGRTIQASRLVSAAYVPAGSLMSDLAALPPFTDLLLDPATLWA